MNFYEQEMRKFFQDDTTIKDQRYCGKTLIGKLDDELRVKLQLVSTGVRDNYNAIRAQIINRTEGQVDCETFKFSDILGENPAYVNNPMAKDIYIWEYNDKASWYGYRPTQAEMDMVADTISGYLWTYQNEDMNLQL